MLVERKTDPPHHIQLDLLNGGVMKELCVVGVVGKHSGRGGLHFGTCAGATPSPVRAQSGERHIIGMCHDSAESGRGCDVQEV
jgi:hypothetical protein